MTSTFILSAVMSAKLLLYILWHSDIRNHEKTFVVRNTSTDNSFCEAETRAIKRLIWNAERKGERLICLHETRIFSLFFPPITFSLQFVQFVLLFLSSLSIYKLEKMQMGKNLRSRLNWLFPTITFLCIFWTFRENIITLFVLLFSDRCLWSCWVRGIDKSLVD